ncbi:dihydroorotate dehydrogenase electron transfer subunit [candidate division WOR-3 bacterium]|jgi:dihydroorotate dehydrogenase electron transfer subunit|nr:dihydroorotate dehydrogenase electron transfer subunit [candidate division WOR-3 bacterium]
MRRIKSQILSNKRLSKELHLITFTSEKIEEDLLPGNFLHILVSSSLDPFLRRPFSIFDISEGTISVLYRVIGKGTGIMKDLCKGDEIDIIGPLGNSYPIDNSNNIYCIAGGTGIASIHFLIEYIKQNHPTKQITLCWGTKTIHEFILMNEFRLISDKIIFSTEDGSYGNEGLITDFLPIFKDNSVIYACGPDGMLHILKKKPIDLPMFFSVEKRMACGVGVCLGCAVKMNNDTYKYTCIDGPVFNANELKYE